MEKYKSKYEMLNKVAAEYWIYGEYGDGFGKPLGMSSGVPESDSSKFARSLKQIKSGINKSQATQPPSTLEDRFPYEPGDFVHFLGPRGRIGLGSIAGIFGGEYRVVHSGTRASTVSNEYVSPTSRTRKSHALRSALSPLLTTIKCRSKSDI